MHNLAVLFAMGADGATDNESAARWFNAAAELGVKDSQFNLGILAAKGVGMPQSLEESYKWFALVAKTGDKDAAAKRDEIANALRPEQLERARAAAELWKPKPLDAAGQLGRHSGSLAGEPGQDRQRRHEEGDPATSRSILNKNGYDAGNPDGVMGGKTKIAIIAFQKDNDMEPTGEIDEKLVRRCWRANDAQAGRSRTRPRPVSALTVEIFFVSALRRSLTSPQCRRKNGLIHRHRLVRDGSSPTGNSSRV